jgi:hypothetical protein
MQQRYYQRLDGLADVGDVPADMTSIAASISSAIQAGTMPNAPAFTGNITGFPPAPPVAIGTAALLLAGGLVWIWLRSRKR